MIEADTWEPRAQLLDAARAAGFRLTEPQLGRLHRAELVPSPRTRSLGRGKGTISEFPPGSTARLLRVLAVQKEERSRKFSTVAWRVWWEDGGPLPAPARELLVDVADRWDRSREELSDLLGRATEGDPDAEQQIDALYMHAEHGRVEGPLGTARGNAGREQFSSVVRVFAEIMAGRFDSYRDVEKPADDGTPQPETTGARVESALRIDRARNDRIAGHQPRFEGSSEAHFAHLSSMVGRHQLTPLTETADDELNAARVEIRDLLTLILTFAPLIQRVAGRDAAGYGTMARMLNTRTPRLQAFALLAWLLLRQDEGLREGMQTLVALLPKVQAMAQLDQLSKQLGEAVPELAPPLSDALHAEALGDADTAVRARAAIKHVSDQHREHVGQFFDAHPEIKRLIATAGDSD